MDSQSESPTKKIQIGLHTPRNFDALPAVEEALKQIFNEPLPQALAADFVTRYPQFSDETRLLIYRAMKYKFKKFQITEQWTSFKEDKPYQPKITDFGVESGAPLEQRLGVIAELASKSATETAFNPLKMLNQFLTVPNNPTIEDTITQITLTENNPTIVNIGCGGQGAEIELLTKPKIKGKAVQMIGIGAFDYGKNLRPDFPEVKDTLTYSEANIYLNDFPENSADLVFSSRTLPYSGVIDAKQFCAAAHKMAKEDGAIRIGDINENNFDLRGTKFKNLEEYLQYLQQTMPHLQFSHQGIHYVIAWIKNEGFPLRDFQATSVLTDHMNLPYQITYSLNASEKSGL